MYIYIDVKVALLIKIAQLDTPFCAGWQGFLSKIYLAGNKNPFYYFQTVQSLCSLQKDAQNRDPLMASVCTQERRELMHEEMSVRTTAY